jgi:multidrug efflux pump
MSIVVVLFGIIGYNYLGVREYPAVDPPIVTVSTSYVGANADVIESQITEPLEESINGIAGIRTITSVSREGRSTITVEFDLDIDMEAATNDVRDRVSRALQRLPPDVDNPIVSKADADSNPIVFLSVSSDSRNALETSEIANNMIRERMQTIPGVSEVRIWGEKRYSMRLWMDPAKLAAYGLTPLDVRQAIDRENIELPSGRIEGFNTELSVRTMSRLETPHEFNNLILKETGGNVVRFRDVGFATLGAENERTVLKRDGVQMVGVVLIPQPGANNIAIADEFYRRLDDVIKDLPSDITTGIGFDVTEYIRASITEVQDTIVTAFILVVIIIFLFLRDWRTTIIPVIVIPIALIGAFFIMFIAGFSINVLTMLALVLAIGLVVDDAIVVMENIYTKIEQGMEPIEASIRGSAEIFFAVISTTTALAAVFMPVIFLEGITGRLFREFGVVLAGSVIISSFVALTLTPMLSSKILKRREKHNFIYTATEPFFSALTNGYQNSLNVFLRFRWLSFVIIALSIGIVAYIGSQVQSELAPLEDRGRTRIFVTAPEGATFEYMDGYIDEIVGVMKDTIPEYANIISVTSPGFGASSSVNTGFVTLNLIGSDLRDRTQQEISDELGTILNGYTGARSFVAQDQTFGGRRGGLPVQFVIQAPNFDALKENLPRFLDAASDDRTFSVVDVDLKFNRPELKIEINRERARALGVSALDIAQTLQLALSGQRFGYFILNGKQYQVIGQLSREYRDAPVSLRSLNVKNNRGELIQLDNVVTISEQSSPPQLFRFNRYVSATVSAGLARGMTLGDGIDAMERIAAETLDGNFTTTLSGTSRDFAESNNSLLFAFALAVVLIYLVLSAQFESFRDPLIILFTVPLAVAGAILSLWAYGQTLNIFSQIGIIMLVGLVTKNGILIVEFANQRKAAGLNIMEAILDAASTRFRPILMTSLSTILGVAPIALALGAGSESRVSMGIAVIGGLIYASLLTLYIIPGMYSYLSSKTAVVSNVTVDPDAEVTLELKKQELSEA